MAGGFSDTNPRTGDEKVRLEDVVDVQKIPPKEWLQVRLIGPVVSYVQYWIKIKTNAGKVVPIPKLCLDHDPIKDANVREVCPYRKAGLRPQKFYLVNAIIRDLQDNEPRKRPEHTKKERKLRAMRGHEDYEAHFKQKGSKSWTPVRVLRIPSSLAGKIKNLTGLNKHKDKKTGEWRQFELSHPKYGMDISLFFNPDVEGTAMYEVQKGDPSKLTDEEKEYLIYQLKVLEPEELEQAKEEWKKLKEKLADSEDDDDDGDKKKRKKGYFDDDDDDDDKPRKKKKKRDDDEDEDEDGDDEDDDTIDMDDVEDEDKPKKKKNAWKKG